ncbi:type II toxin-antitoxin system VapC family toxin [Nocardioides sp. LML1-1-1.1]|uniref:type II toxin-antitoxin system VapC family toxin n=1 Tax=Nocardioides sp. LML1-1-1.1 TaxID=3135248 RepID=UPI0034241D0A
MIVDTSALIAILRDEPERDEFAQLIVDQPARISAANWVEAAMVAEGDRGDRGDRLDRLVATARIVIEPVTESHARAARIAFRRYGRGSGSPARLNFGDCFAYALSATSGEPLLFKGDDFTHTDVLPAR